MRPTVLLFDVDGTLLTTVGVGRRAMERALASLHGSASALEGIRFDGMTDRAIVRTALAALGEAAEGRAAETAIDRVLAAYLPLLAEEVAASRGLALHRGVGAALDAAASRPGVALGLGTGNVREGARLKLSHVGVFERFGFGGFGCDHEDRAEILRIAAARGAAAIGAPLAACRVVVVGDTPRDIEAARAIGAESIGVGTSRSAPAELLAHGANFAFDDLAAPGALAALLDGRTPPAAGEG